MKPIARMIATAAFILAFAMVICLIFAGLCKKDSGAHYFFVGLADKIRIVLLFGVPLWVFGLIFGIGN